MTTARMLEYVFNGPAAGKEEWLRVFAEERQPASKDDLDATVTIRIGVPSDRYHLLMTAQAYGGALIAWQGQPDDELPCRTQGRSVWVCTHCLPALIHG